MFEKKKKTRKKKKENNNNKSRRFIAPQLPIIKYNYDNEYSLIVLRLLSSVIASKKSFNEDRLSSPQLGQCHNFQYTVHNRIMYWRPACTQAFVFPFISTTHKLFEKLYNGLLYFSRLLLLMNLLVSSRFEFASWQVAHGRLMIPWVWNKSEIRMEVNEDCARKEKQKKKQID